MFPAIRYSTRHVLLIFLMLMCDLVYSEVLVLCPDKIHWKTVGQVFCPVNPGYYHCLQRKDTNELKPECIKPIMIPRGYYPVLDEFYGNIDIENCPVGEYQPRSMFTNEDYKCVYRKSKCSEEGQLVYSYGSTTEDFTCRCDHTRGYSFVDMPARECDCVPSKEDCSCYRMMCTDHSDLTKDYKCLSNEKDIQNKTSVGRNCSLILPISSLDDHGSNKDDMNRTDETYSNIPKLDTKNRRHAANFIISLVCIYAFILVVLYVWKQYHNVHGALKLMVDKDLYTDHIGSEVTLTVCVVEAGDIASCIFGSPDIRDICWKKNDVIIDLQEESGKYFVADCSKPDLLIRDLKFEDEAEYQCVVDNYAGNAYMSEKIKLTVVNTTGRALQPNVPPEIQQLGRPGIEKFKRILKSAVCKYRTIQLIFVGPKCSGKTSLIHNILGINMVNKIGLFNKFFLMLDNDKWTVTDYSKDRSGNILNIMKALVDEDPVKELQDEYIDLIIIDIPGGIEYLSVFEPFLSRKALFVLTVDVSKSFSIERKHTLSNPMMERKSGEEIQNWLYSIHSLKPTDQDSATHLDLHPSVILVGTHEDTVQTAGRDLLQKLKKDTISCVYQKKVISKHIVHSCVLSNEQFSEGKKKDLQDIIIKVSKSQDNWDNDIPVRYLWFERILIEKRSKMAAMSFDDILELGKASGYPVTDKREFQQFLSYEHKVRNVIFYPDIPDFVIINPEWLLGIFKALITLFHSETESKSDYQLKGLISENSLNTILQDLGSDWSENQELLKNFDVVVGARNAGKIKSEHESSYSYEYYVPFLIPENRKADVVSLFSRSRRNKTSFLCFSFDYLPATLINHVMNRLLDKYKVSVTPYTGESAVYYRTLVLEYNSRTNLKLYFYSQKNELLIQVWFYGVQEILVCFENVRKFMEQIINSFKIRHGMNVNYTYKLKCPDSVHADTDVWEILSNNADRTFYCHHHNRIHPDFYTTWFSGDQESKVKESTGAKKNLEVMMGKTIQGRASVLGIPTIKVEETSYSVSKSSVVTLKCQVRMMAGNVTWRRQYKGHECKLSSQTTKYSGGTSATPSLTIYNVGEDDQGLYWCEATNSCGIATSVQINLTVYGDEPEPPFPDLKTTSAQSLIEDKGNLAESPLHVLTYQEAVSDAVVIHVRQDEDSAVEFIQHLERLKDEMGIPDLKVTLQRDLQVPGYTMVQSFNRLFESARFVLIIVTERLKDSKFERFIAEKALMESLSDGDKLYRVVPVSMAGPQHMPEELVPLIAIQYHHYRKAELEGKKDKIYTQTLGNMFRIGRNNYLV